MVLTIKHFMIFVSQVFPTNESLSKKNNEKNYHKILKQTVNLVLQSQIFTQKKTLESIKNKAWINKAAKTQRHIKKILSIPPHKIGFSARVSLRLLLNIFLNKTINPMAQSKKTSLVVKENLNLKSSYVFTGFVPSGLFYIYIDICTKKVTGPKRLKSNVSPVCYQPFFLFAFGAFFLATNKALPIKSRRGAGARTRYPTSFCENIFSSFKAKEKNVFVSCTFAVSFFFLFFALNVSLIQTQKKSNGGDMHNV